VSGGRGIPADAGAIFFLTDYGHSDELAGVVRAVLARLAPGAPVVDLTHEVPAFDVRAGALALERAARHLGPGVVLGVVDPGVGTERRAVAVGVEPPGGPRALVGPDNGLLLRAADVLGGVRSAVVLARAAGEDRVTFDGRDVFAPAAAALWGGAPLEELGRPLPPGQLVRLPEPRLRVGNDGIEAEVLWVDRFGNVQLCATAAHGRALGLAPGVLVEVGVSGAVVPAAVVRAFTDLEAPGAPSELGVLVDANGRLALVRARAAAATVLAVQAGDLVTLRRPGGHLTGAPSRPEP
jgi:S-adenosylmethionine hydrolase